MKKIMLAVVMMMGLGSAAMAVPLQVDSGWQSFSWDGLGFTTPSFLLSGPATIDLTDRYIIGDQFSLYDGATLLGTTSDTYWDGLPSGCSTGDACWANPFVSKGSFLLGVGSHSLRIKVVDTAPRYPSGSGFIRATSTSVPEPGSLALLGAGLLGLAMLRRRQVIG